MKKRILISIIVIIFLIVGAVFYFNEFGRAKNVNDIGKHEIDELFKDDSRTGENEEIKNLFVDEGKSSIDFPGNIIEVFQGESYNVRFRIKNLLENQSFNWKIKIMSIVPSELCEMDNINLISSELDGNSIIEQGNTFTDVIKFDIPQNIIKGRNNCIVHYELIVTKEDGTYYNSNEIIIVISEF